MSRSWRSPRTATKVHADRRKKMLQEIDEEELEEQLVVSGCSQCGKGVARYPSGLCFVCERLLPDE